VDEREICGEIRMINKRTEKKEVRKE